MSIVDDNIALIQRHFKNEVLGQSSLVLDEMTDDCHYYMIPVVDGPINGKESIRAIHEGLIAAFSDMYIDVEEIIATEDTVAAKTVLGGRQTGEWDGIPATGKDVKLSTAVFFKIRDGMVVSESIYFDRREMLRQLDIKETLEL
jgi:steroid delta-isomerase-like uncharacterized protein